LTLINEKKLTRRRFLKYLSLAGLFASYRLLFLKEAKPAQSPDEKARDIAESFLEETVKNSIDKVKEIELIYDIHMKCEWGMNMKMNASFKMQKQGDSYTSTFNLTKPIGTDGWSKFILYLFGKHTQEYKEMIKNIETRFDETFHLIDKRFITDKLKEIIPQKKLYENQTGIKFDFDYERNLVKFWEDQTQKDFSKAIPYTNQVGPLTGVFNFIFFNQPETDLYLINALVSAIVKL